MRLDNQQLFTEFFEENKEDFPNVSYEQMKEIISGPWRQLNRIMSEGLMEEMRIKYFGNFTLYPKRVQSELSNLERRYKSGTVAEKDYIRIKTMINKYLDEQKRESNSK